MSYHYPYDDYLLSRDTYPPSLSTATNLSLIRSFTMFEYTNTEHTDMVLVYDEAASNGRAASRIYLDRYPHGVTPLHTLFAKVIQRPRERGTFTVNRGHCAAPSRRRTPNFEEDVLHLVEESPSTGTRTIASGMDVPHSTIWEVLFEQKVPLPSQRLHSISPADFALRANFCKWLFGRAPVSTTDILRR